MKNIVLRNWAIAGTLLLTLAAPLEAQAERNAGERPQEYTLGIGSLEQGFPGTDRDIVLRMSRTWARAKWRPSFSAELNVEAMTVDQWAGRLAIGVVRSALLSKSGLILSGHGDLGPTLPSGVSGAVGVAIDHPVWGSDLLGVELEYRQRYGFECDRAEGLLAMFVRWSV